MVIYGTALLAFCMLVGLMVGQLLGDLLGVGKNVGGVGIAMLLLIVMSDWLRRRDRLPVPTQQGVLFWSAIYIPIVVAMAATRPACLLLFPACCCSTKGLARDGPARLRELDFEGMKRLSHGKFRGVLAHMVPLTPTMRPMVH